MGKNTYLNLFKIIAAFSVLWAHTCTPHTLPSFQFAVPFFFLISGFYSYNAFINLNAEKMKNKAVKILKMFFISMCIYLVVELLIRAVMGTEKEYFVQFKYASSYVKLILFNLPFPTAQHLWFLLALSYVYIAIYIYIYIYAKIMWKFTKAISI